MIHVLRKCFPVNLLRTKEEKMGRRLGGGGRRKCHFIFGAISATFYSAKDHKIVSFLCHACMPWADLSLSFSGSLWKRESEQLTILQSTTHLILLTLKREKVRQREKDKNTFCYCSCHAMPCHWHWLLCKNECVFLSLSVLFCGACLVPRLLCKEEQEVCLWLLQDSSLK